MTWHHRHANRQEAGLVTGRTGNGPEVEYAAEEAIKTASINLNNRFKDFKGKHGLNYEKWKACKNARWSSWRWEDIENK